MKALQILEQCDFLYFQKRFLACLKRGLPLVELGNRAAVGGIETQADERRGRRRQRAT